MTITLLFFANGRLVLRRNMGATNLYDKILDKFSEEELNRYPIEEDNGYETVITDQEFIEKVWYVCVEYGYISTDHDIMGKFVGTLHIVP
jgi:hypothetical protein